MKLTGDLKDKVFNTDSLEERRDIIAQAGMELTDDELEAVAGGIAFMQDRIKQENRKGTSSANDGQNAIRAAEEAMREVHRGLHELHELPIEHHGHTYENDELSQLIPK